MHRIEIDEFGVITGLRGYCKGGGGGGSTGGGGGGSGAVDYPDYMKTFHADILNKDGTVTVGATKSIVGLINTAHSNNPFTGENAFDPDTDIAAMETALSGLNTIISAIDPITTFDAYLTDAIAEVAPITAAIEAIDITAQATAVASGLGDAVDNEITTKVLPRFQRGMQDINAVQSSTFVIGQAVIEGFRDTDVARATSDYLAKGHVLQTEGIIKSQLSATQLVEMITKMLMVQLEYEKSYALSIVEQRRIKIVAKNEQSEVDRSIDEHEAAWDLEVMQHGANMLASIGGGVVAPTSGSGRNDSQRSAIGGALAGGLSGAAAGAMVGGPLGAAIGGVLGIGASFL
jgi:hypothetical protein